MPVSLGVLLVTPVQRTPEPRPASGTLARPGTGRPGRGPAEDRQIPPAQRCASPAARPNVAGPRLAAVSVTRARQIIIERASRAWPFRARAVGGRSGAYAGPYETPVIAVQHDDNLLI